VYYHLYVDDSEMPSKMAYDPEEPFLGRIRADFVAPPHNPASIRRCISRVERIRLTHADLFADISCDIPLKESHILKFFKDGPGQSPNKPMAIVVQVGSSPILDGKYVIKNREEDIYWAVRQFLWTPRKVYSWTTTMDQALAQDYVQVNEHSLLVQLFKCSKNKFLSKWDITHDTNGNVFMASPSAPSSWVGAELRVSAVPVPWRLIPGPADSHGSNFY
jgi:hypothetical protein